jgi:hypothetical protein
VTINPREKKQKKQKKNAKIVYKTNHSLTTSFVNWLLKIEDDRKKNSTRRNKQLIAPKRRKKERKENREEIHTFTHTEIDFLIWSSIRVR